MEKNIRIILTGLVLLIGGYYIQQTSKDVGFFSGYIDNANADVPPPGPAPGS